jgi:hypothetical protein
MMAASTEKDWRELCAAATVERDSEKLFSLVNQILQVFDDRDQKLMSPDRPSNLSCQE